MPITWLINILWDHSDGRAKNRTQPVSTPAFVSNQLEKKKKSHKILLPVFNTAAPSIPSELEGDLLWMAAVCTVTYPTVLQNSAGIPAGQWDVKAGGLVSCSFWGLRWTHWSCSSKFPLLIRSESQQGGSMSDSFTNLSVPEQTVPHRSERVRPTWRSRSDTASEGGVLAASAVLPPVCAQRERCSLQPACSNSSRFPRLNQNQPGVWKRQPHLWQKEQRCGGEEMPAEQLSPLCGCVWGASASQHLGAVTAAFRMSPFLCKAWCNNPAVVQGCQIYVGVCKTARAWQQKNSLHLQVSIAAAN